MNPGIDRSAVKRGHEILERELRNSLILPKPAQCLRRILAAIQLADEALRAPVADVADPLACAGGVLLAMIDECLRALAELGGAR